ncbi:MAG: hypothetical protein MZU97_11435 [Bacillus subtilis]|nr:hypothetical protein [Bacillus subtilis]
MAARVYRLNRSYETGVGDEHARLTYVKKALDADLKSVRRATKHEIARIEKNRLATHQLAKIRFDKLVAAYEELKLQLHDNMEAENRAIDAGLAAKEAAIKARLESLATSVQALPAKKQGPPRRARGRQAGARRRPQEDPRSRAVRTRKPQVQRPADVHREDPGHPRPPPARLRRPLQADGRSPGRLCPGTPDHRADRSTPPSSGSSPTSAPTSRSSRTTPS